MRCFCPMLVGCIAASTISTALAEMQRMAPFVDAFELRLDFFCEEELFEVGRLMESLPCIFTFRKKAEGGVREIEEKKRLAWIEKLLELQPAYCDIEADTDPIFVAKVSQKFPFTKFIGSFHDFEKTPADLPALLRKMENFHFSFYKIAAFASTTLDLLRMMQFAKERGVSCISLGEKGAPSRVLGPIVGSPFDYVGWEECKTLHRMSLRTLHEVFRYRHLFLGAPIYALIGDPVEQSIGHIYHNQHLQEGVYVKMRLLREELSSFFSLVKELPFAGFSVTMPLKETVLPFLDEMDEMSQAIGAVNTIAIRGGKLYGTNTDAPGALNAIEKYYRVARKRVAILGTGGSAKAIGYEARKRGADVAFFGRNKDRFLAASVLPPSQNPDSTSCFGIEELDTYPYDILINTIPCDIGIIPIKGTVVLDIVYSPKETALLQAAQKLGCLCVYGEEMFYEQARLQQLFWKEAGPFV